MLKLLALCAAVSQAAADELRPDFNCTHSFEAECAAGHQPSWNKNLTCDECVRKVDKEIHARKPDASCDDEARAFLKGDCEAGANTFSCKHSFEAECGADRPPWTANLTCDECVRTIDSDIKRREPGTNCDEAARVFVKDGCKDSPRSLDCKKEFKMECNSTARPDWNKNLTCPECVKALDEAIHKRDPSAKCDKEAKAFEKKECSKAPTDGCKNDQSEYCCPDAKHCLTPTEKTCAAAGDKCDAGEVCCPLTKLCVTAGAVCTPPPVCGNQSYCGASGVCIEVVKTLAGTVCGAGGANDKCPTGTGVEETCDPLTKLCVVTTAKACALPKVSQCAISTTGIYGTPTCDGKCHPMPPPPGPPSPGPPVGPNNQPTKKGGKKHSTGETIIGVVAALLVIALIGFGVWTCQKRSKDNKGGSSLNDPLTGGVQ